MSLGSRLLGDLAYLLGGSAVRRTLAMALPERSAAERAAIARASARLRMRRYFDPWARLDDVALCRRLSWEGAAPLRDARAAPGALFLSAPLGVPELARRAVRIYCGDPAARLVLLPTPSGVAPGGDARLPLLGRSVRSGADWARAIGVPVFPIFATLEPGGRYRVELQHPLDPSGDDPDALVCAAIARIEAAVAERPESWPWAEWAHQSPAR